MSTTETYAETAGARHRVEDFVAGMKDKASQIKTKSLDDIWTGTRDYVKDNPGKTILVSLALGVVIGSLLRRR